MAKIKLPWYYRDVKTEFDCKTMVLNVSFRLPKWAYPFAILDGYKLIFKDWWRRNFYWA